MNHQLNDVIKHYGVKGMRWGVKKNGDLTRASKKRNAAYSKGLSIRDRYKLKRITSSEARKKYIDDKDKTWMDKTNNDANIKKVTSRTARDMKRINKELKKEYGSSAKLAFNPQARAKLNKELKSAYEEVIADNTYAVYKMSPSRTREVKIKAMSDGTLKANIVERENIKLSKQRQAINKAANKRAAREAKTLKQSAITDSEENIDGMFFIILPDEDGFPDEIVQPFEDELQQFTDLDNTLQHFGVKGMRWGVRRDNRKVTVRDKLSSMKRERQWKKVLNEVDNMSNEQITAVTKRVRLENDFKKLTRESKISKTQDKKDYVKRADMSDDELSEKITRLRVKDSLAKSVSDATKEQREIGEKVVSVGNTLALKYATDKKLTGEDIFRAIVYPDKESKKKMDSQVKDKAVRAIIDNVLKRQ